MYLNSENYSMNRLNRRVDPMPLYSRPPSCSSQEQSTRQAEVARGRSFNGFRQTGQIVDQFTIVDQAIDCEMQRWVLVQTPQGTNGWIKHYDLEQNAKIDDSTWRFDWIADRRQRRTCENAISECREKIAQITGTETTRTDGLMTVVVNAAEGVTPSIKDFQMECYDNQQKTTTTGQASSNQNSGYGGYTNLNGIALRQMREKLENRKKEILKQLNLTQWSQVPEDFREVFSAMERQLSESAPRSDSYYGTVVSMVNTRVFDEVLKLQPPQSGAAPVAAAPVSNGPAYFGDMTGYQGQTQNYSSYNQGSSPYRNMLDEINYNWMYDQRRVRQEGAAAATNITEIRQPLGPASAPRGIQDREITEMVQSKNEVRRMVREHEATCKNYPDGFTMQKMQPLIASANIRDLTDVLDSHLPRLDRQCQFFDALVAGQDLSDLRNCDYGGCEMYYMNAAYNPPELDRQYFPMDYIQKYKHLMKPKEVMRALSSRYERDLAQYGLTSAGQYSGNGCSYDPLKTLEKIEELSKLDCVGSIFVPEGDLFNGAERKSIPKVSFRPMETNDSYQLLFKSCPIEGYETPVVETETPRPTSNAQ
jgi:hypothetical protein